MAKRKAGSARVVNRSTSTTKWLQNAAKSIGLSTKKAFGEYAPNVTDVAISGTKTARTVIQTVRKGGNVDRITNQLKSNRYVKFMNTAYRNAISDIRTGNLNNEERLQNSLFGDSDDLSDALEGFSFGDDGADSNINIINASDNGAIMALSNNMEKQAQANIKVQKASMDAYIAVNAASMQQRGELGNQIISQLANVNNNLAALVDYHNNNMNQFIEAAMGWMEKTGPHLSGEDDEQSNRAKAHDVINNGRGGINLGEYKRYVKAQFKDAAKNSSVGMVASLLDDDALNMLASNPLGFATDAIMKAAMPKMLKTSLEAMDKTFETMVPTLLTEIGEWAEEGGIKGLIGQVFGINLRESRTSNFKAKINYDAIPFDGETKHAITQIITKELADQTGYLKIIAAKVSHKNPDKLEAQVRNNREFWDRENSRFVKGQEGVDGMITDRLTAAIRDAISGTDFGSKMNDLVRVQKNEKAQKSMQDAMDRFFLAIEKSDGKLDAAALINIASSLSSTGNTSAFKSIAKHIEKLNAENKNAIYSANTARITANNSLEDTIKDIEDHPEIYNLFNSSYNNDDEEIRDRLSAALEARQKASKRIAYKKSKENYSQNSGTNDIFSGFLGGANNAMRSIMSGDANGAVTAMGSAMMPLVRSVGSVLSDTLGDVSNIGESIKHGVMERLFGKKWNEETESYDDTDDSIIGSIKSKFTDGVAHISSALFGEEDPEEIKNQLAEHAKKLLPTAGTGAAVGTGVGILAGSSILGSLIGGPIGGAVLGMTTSLVTKSEKFQKWFFGEEIEDENGNKTRSGGILDSFISKDTQKMFKDNKNKLIGSATLGAISGTITGGGILGTVLGGPIAGAALGVAGTLLSQNEKVQTFLWGKEKGIKVGDKEFDKKGIFGQVASSIKVDFINPLKTTGQYILKDMKTTLLYEIAAPFKVLTKHVTKSLKDKGAGLLRILIGDENDPNKNGLLGILSKPVKAMFDKGFGALGKTISTLGEATWKLTKRVVTFPGKLLAVALSKPIKFIRKGIHKIGDLVTSGITGVFKFIKTGLSTIIGTPLKKLGKFISDSFVGRGVRKAKNYVKDKVSKGTGAIGTWFRGVEDSWDRLVGGDDELNEARKKARDEHAANKAWLKEQKALNKRNSKIANLTGGQFTEDTEEAREYAMQLATQKNGTVFRTEEQKKDWLERQGLRGDAIKKNNPQSRTEQIETDQLEESRDQTGILRNILDILNENFGSNIISDLTGGSDNSGGEGRGRRRIRGGAGVLGTIGSLLLKGLSSTGSSVVNGVKNNAANLANRSISGLRNINRIPSVNPDATDDRAYNSRLSQREKNDAALDTARDRAHTADELRAEAQAEKDKKKENAFITVMKETRDEIKTQTSNWDGIFGKKGLITAGLIGAFLFLKKNLPGLLNTLGSLASSVGGLATGFLNVLGGTGAEAADEMSFTNKYNARTNGNTAAEEYQKQVNDIKNFDIFTDANGDATSQTNSRLRFAANMGKEWAFRSVKGGSKTGRRIRGAMRAVDKVGSGIGKVASTFWNGKAVDVTGDSLAMLQEAQLGPKAGGIKGLAKNSKIGKAVAGKGEKALKLVTDALTKFADTGVGKLGKKIGGGAKKFFDNFVSAVLKGVKSHIDDFAAKVAGKITALTGKNVSAAAVTLGLSEVAFATLGAIDGISGTAKLFKVDKSAVDGKMKVIAGAIGAVTGTTVGSIIDIVLSFVGPILGTDLLHDLATGIYEFWTKKSGDDGAAAKLQTAQKDFQNQYLEYREEEYQKAYEAYKKDGTIPSDLSYEDFVAGVEDGTYTVDYKSFEDWNVEQNGAFSDKIASGIGKAVKGVGKGIKKAGKWLFNHSVAGSAYALWKNRDTIKTAISNDASIIRNKVSSSVSGIKDKISGVYDSVKKRGDAFIDTVKREGIVPAATSTIINGVANKVIKTEAWIDQDGCFYIKKAVGSVGKWSMYTPAGDKIEDIDEKSVRALQSSGLLISTDVPDFAKTDVLKTRAKIGSAIASGASKLWSNLSSKLNSLYSKSSESGGSGTASSNSLFYKISTLLNSNRDAGRFGGAGDTLNGSTYFSQSDPRWGNKSYNMGFDDATMDTTGCGPTAMAMAASDALGGNINPMSMANLAKAFGDRDATGTNWDFINQASGAMGLRSQQALNPSADYISSQLDTGNPVILSGASGGGSVPYTPAGHYVVAVGKDGNGNVIVNDPRGRGYSGAYNLNAVANKTGSAWTIGGSGRRIIRGGGKMTVGITNNENEATNTDAVVSKTLSDYQKWISIIRSVKKAIADKKLGYSQSNHTTISIGDKVVKVRTDCSGFVTTCLKYYGVISDTTNLSSADYKDHYNKTLLASGFVPRAWSGWAGLKEGDILGTKGHVEIFAYIKDGKHYVYNCGSDSSCNNPNATSTNRTGYITVWSPGSAGASCINDFSVLATDATGETVTADAAQTGASTSVGASSDEGAFSKLINYVGGAISKFAGNVLGGKMNDDYSVSSILGNTSTDSMSGTTDIANETSISPANVDSSSSNAKNIWNYFTQNGYSKAATAAIMGNLHQESRLDPTIKQYGGGPGRGLAQWEEGSDRFNRLKQIAAAKGKDWSDLGSQLEFINNELSASDIDNRMRGKTAPSNLTKIGLTTADGMGFQEWKSSNDVGKATKIFEAAYERAGKPEINKRISYAQGYYDSYANGGAGTGLRRQRRGGYVTRRAASPSGGYGNACVNHVKRLHGGYGIGAADNYTASKYVSNTGVNSNSSSEELMLAIVKILTYIASDTSSSNAKLDMLKNIGTGNVNVNNNNTIVGSNGKAVSQKTVSKSDAAYDKIAQSIAKGGY